MPAFELVIFDCDGTLVDSEAACNRFLHEALTSLGLSMSEEQLFDLVIGKSTEATVSRLAQSIPGAEPEDIFEAIERAELEAVASGITAMPGAHQALERFQGRSCVASNGSRAKMTASLTNTGLIGWVEGRLHSSEHVPHPKPAPDIFLHCAQIYGVDVEQCLVIEDSEAGLLAAREASMAAIGLTHLLAPERVIALGARPCPGLVEWLEKFQD